MPEDGSVALPTTNVDDYTSAVAVANCNVKASILHDVPVLGNKNPSTWLVMLLNHLPASLTYRYKTVPVFDFGYSPYATLHRG